MAAVKSRTDLDAELCRVIGRFRRQLRRSAGHGFTSARLTESQAELLWLVGQRPGISVSLAAAELGLVANTASTLVSKLVAQRLLVRTVDAADRRVGRLWLTESAQQMVDASRAARRAVLSEVLGELDQSQIAALTEGLEVLENMTQMMRERST
ncbi:MarR family transcriptional regulator [Mycobacterium heckeshornense]|uniref:MarR family transcriptional regulator n=1 Tax=Mycobacterium heckeshornense TaxID=110505 RepID=A0A2G8BCK1_9MYCO|nr:MarR family transcriptional regulator [Mycobacterium heckeshornense]KMV18407.1 MarR family transcriptional regulator [Mycobacterium heckeshornense]MCV7034236.1 MarR family transcriptional regulator [Mycobacterium heckeshornense]PIJ35412.1 MarR family transcriptional regulator [Mycobacterium heckeshornense]BCO38310.1 MarR family transcriptional regulator [Mycobacterium heckeshornense]BCQ11163.1 MarR family transcriptional regulator [Mycobacterium heckeshornense]